MGLKKYIYVTATCFSFCLSANSGVVIDQSAISDESVYPEYENSSVIENRQISLTNRFQLGLFVGQRRNDPYFNSVMYNGSLAYHFAEEHAIQLSAALFSNSPSSASDELDKSTVVKNLNLAPSPDALYLLSYKILPFYGKVSFSKNAVQNLNLYATLGTGVIEYPGKSIPVLQVGVGQDLYIKNEWGISLDLKGLFYDAPDAASTDLSTVGNKQDASFFRDIKTFNFLVNFGIIKLF